MMQQFRSFSISGFTVRVVLSEVQMSHRCVVDPAALNAAHFVPFGEPGDIPIPVRDAVTISIALSPDCIPTTHQREWEEYLQGNGFWERDDKDESSVIYLYETTSSDWRRSLKYFLSGLTPAGGISSCDHLIQIASDMPLDELTSAFETFEEERGTTTTSGSRRERKFNDRHRNRLTTLDLMDSSSRWNDASFVLGGVPPTSISRSRFTSATGLVDGGNTSRSTITTQGPGGGRRVARGLPHLPTNGSGTDSSSCFTQYLKRQELKRQFKKQSREKLKMARQMQQQQYQDPAADGVGATKNGSPPPPATKRRKKKKPKTSRRVHKEISSVLPVDMKHADCDLIVARGLFKHGIDTANSVLDAFKEYLVPTGSDDGNFSAFVTWKCECCLEPDDGHGSSTVAGVAGGLTCDPFGWSDDEGNTELSRSSTSTSTIISAQSTNSRHNLPLFGSCDVGDMTKRIFDDIMTCLRRENPEFDVLEPIQCCRIDYYGGSGEVPIHEHRDSIFGNCRETPMTVISLSLLSPRNYVVDRMDGVHGNSHEFHVRNGDIIVHDGLFFKHFRTGFQQNKERIHSHNSPRLSLTFMPIITHNCCLGLGTNTYATNNNTYDTMKNNSNNNLNFINPNVMTPATPEYRPKSVGGLNPFATEFNPFE